MEIAPEFTLRPENELKVALFEYVDGLYRFIGDERAQQAMANPPVTQRSLELAGLYSAYLQGPQAGSDVGSYVMNLPAAVTAVSTDESPRLPLARQAARLESARLRRWSEGTQRPEDEELRDESAEAGDRLLLLRGRLAHSEDDLWAAFQLVGGETIPVSNPPENLSGPVWAVIEVQSLHEAQSPVGWFDYNCILAFPDRGGLRVSDVHPSLAKCVLFDAVVGHILAHIDLSGLSAVEPMSAMAFLLNAHRIGVGSTVRERYSFVWDSPTWSFESALRGAMQVASIGSGPSTQPEPRLVKSAREAEVYAAEYMRYLGFSDAAVTPPGADGGVDVVASGAVAQVKMEGLPTGRAVIQAIRGVAAVEGKAALVFSLAGFTPQALEWADRAGTACFEFMTDGTVVPVGQESRRLMQSIRQHERSE